ncbi:LysR family transcriptional regulator [Priestia endophytica]|uniref:LysR family transcriptional regulator n=1 Tax=Priestia endophytica TaxID=135735 RepID=UPI000DCA44DB|nr:LysR family transcriptional regulator [Priestia endophytica]RAS78318.1 LysR family transcriptional regulator [Priestia endophytica]
MDERDWLILRTLYIQQNITKAAKSLYISQPALTNRLKQIEKEFGVQVVIRGRRGVQFTPQGEYLAHCSEDMLLRIQSIKENVLNMEDDFTGTLKLGVSNLFAQYLLPDLLKMFKDQYPKIEFKVTTDQSSSITHLVHNGSVHVGFVKGDYSWNDRKHLLFQEEVCIASKEKIELENLPRMPRIDYRADPLLRTLVENWWVENYPQPPNVSIEVDKADTAKKMIINGLGYAILPTMTLNDAPIIHKIPLQNKQGELILRNTWMFYHEESMQLNMVKAFVNFVEKMTFKAS